MKLALMKRMVLQEKLIIPQGHVKLISITGIKANHTERLKAEDRVSGETQL